jgi:hypothetical protein
MNYTKPEITSLASATFAIQGSTGKPEQNVPDSTEPVHSITAYEADE